MSDTSKLRKIFNEIHVEFDRLMVINAVYPKVKTLDVIFDVKVSDFDESSSSFGSLFFIHAAMCPLFTKLDKISL